MEEKIGKMLEKKKKKQYKIEHVASLFPFVWFFPAAAFAWIFFGFGARSSSEAMAEPQYKCVPALRVSLSLSL
jgi:hypothetical protein